MDILEKEIETFSNKKCGAEGSECKNKPQNRYTLYVEKCSCNEEECSAASDSPGWTKWTPCESCFEKKIESLVLDFHFDDVRVFRLNEEVTDQFGFFSDSEEE